MTVPGVHLHSTVTGTCRWGGGGGGWKPDPVSNRSAHKKYTLSQYTLLKTFHMHRPTMWEGERERGGESFAIERWFKVRWYWYGLGLSILLCIIIPRRFKSWSSNKFNEFNGHTKAFYTCYGVFDARCSMPPISWEELKVDFISDRISRIFHLLFDQTK